MRLCQPVWVCSAPGIVKTRVHPGYLWHAPSIVSRQNTRRRVGHPQGKRRRTGICTRPSHRASGHRWRRRPSPTPPRPNAPLSAPHRTQMMPLRQPSSVGGAETHKGWCAAWTGRWKRLPTAGLDAGASLARLRAPARAVRLRPPSPPDSPSSASATKAHVALVPLRSGRWTWRWVVGLPSAGRLRAQRYLYISVARDVVPTVPRLLPKDLRSPRS